MRNKKHLDDIGGFAKLSGLSQVAKKRIEEFRIAISFFDTALFFCCRGDVTATCSRVIDSLLTPCFTISIIFSINLDAAVGDAGAATVGL